jgi:hypothetical protein
MSKPKPIVCYLFTNFDKRKSFLNFVKHYKKFKSGFNHDLIICYKLMDNKKILKYENLIKNIKHNIFVDQSIENDWDFGSYNRVAKNFKNRVILFMNSHSYPITISWLKKFMKHFKHKTIIASAGSYESITKQVKLKWPFNILSFFKKKIKAKKSFSNFPNPHLNTSSFMIKSNDFMKYINDRKFLTKYETWKIESGFNSLTNYFKTKDYDLLVVNSDGHKFSQNNWMNSETYHYKHQSKSVISDKHSRKYLKLNKIERKKSQKAVWGV